MAINKQDVATQLDEAAMQATPVEQISMTTAFTEEEAYDIQRLSMEQRYDRGDHFVGLKLGFTSWAKMEQMGVHDMIWGRLTKAMWYKSGDEAKMSKFIHPRAEPEIAFLLKEDITREITLEEIPDYIKATAAAIEIIDSRYKNFKFSLEDVIADNCSSSAFVVGEWKKLPESLNGLKMSLRFDDETKESDMSDAILDNPYLSICNASRLAAKYGQTFPAGSVLLAGAATPAVFVEQGKTVHVEVEGLGAVSLSFS